MRLSIPVMAICLLATPGLFAQSSYDDILGKRGDTNNDESVNMSDIIYLSNYLFSGGDAPPCMNQADANDDGAVNNADPAYLSNWLFGSGSPPPAPGPVNADCDPDPTGPFLGCLDPYCD